MALQGWGFLSQCCPLITFQVEMERALLEGELRTEKKEIEKEEEMIHVLHEQLRETEKKWQEERQKVK